MSHEYVRDVRQFLLTPRIQSPPKAYFTSGVSFPTGQGNPSVLGPKMPIQEAKCAIYSDR